MVDDREFIINNVIDTNLKLEKLHDISSDAEGKNSTVFIGKDIQLDAEFLVKKIKKDSLIKSCDDIFEEAKILSKSKHRNIMPIQYATFDEEYVYLAIPYFKKGSMSCFCNKSESNRQLIAYVLDFLSGLTHLHTLSIIHADIKPSNIIIDDSDSALLTDFGQSQLLEENGYTKTIKGIYKINFSPSLIKGNNLSIQDDIYQVGMTLYRLFNSYYYEQSLDNVTSFEDLKIQVLNNEFPMNNYMPHIPKKLIKIIKKCLGNDSNSYDSILQLMNEVAIINDMLDIGFEYIPKKHTFYWSKKTNTAILNIELDFNQKIISGKKTITASGKTTNIKDVTGTFESLEKAFCIVRKKLEE